MILDDKLGEVGKKSLCYMLNEIFMYTLIEVY